MPYEIIIGNGGQQPFIIPGSCRAVSHNHARFYVDDNGNWFIEDLTGPNGNGTYVQDCNGVFRKIQTMTIDRDSVIRLGCGGHNSFTFYANRIIAPDDFSYEFSLIHERLREIQQEQVRLEADNEKKSKRIKTIRTVGGFLTLVFLGVGLVTGSPLGFAPAALSGGIAAFLPAPDQKQLKALMERKKSVMVCPRCFSPISEAAIYNRVCPLCKAKG